MGLYNNVNLVLECPCCGADVIDFQTKSGELSMSTVQYWEVDEFLSSCDKCGMRIWIHKPSEFDWMIKLYPPKPFKEYIRHPKVNDE